MKIRSHLNRLHALAIFLGLLVMATACARDNEITPADEGKEETVVSFLLANRSSSADADAEIRTLRVIAFDSSDGHFVCNLLLDFTSNPVSVKMLCGKRDFYVIANEPSGMKGALDAVRHYEGLRAVRIPALSLYAGNAFVAFGSATAQTIVASTNQKVTINNMKRLAAKIDLTLRGKGSAKPQTVSFDNLPDEVPLFENIACDAVSPGTVQVTTLTDATPESGYAWTQKADGIVVPSYLPTAMAAEKAARLSVTLDDGKTVRSNIGHKVSGNDYAIQRNTVYALTGNVDADMDISVKTEVAPWNMTGFDSEVLPN